MKKITARPSNRRSGDGELIFIVYFFGKAKKILKLNFSAVVEHCGAAHFAENLMLIGDNDFCIYKGISVYNRDKIHIKPAVRRFKCPRVGKIVADIENYIIEHCHMSKLPCPNQVLQNQVPCREQSAVRHIQFYPKHAGSRFFDCNKTLFYPLPTEWQ